MRFGHQIAKARQHVAPPARVMRYTPGRGAPPAYGRECGAARLAPPRSAQAREEKSGMSDVPSVRLPFGTVAALFPSLQAAEAAAATLEQRGYPRPLISVLTGRPWQNGTAEPTGFVPDPELRFQLLPASPLDAPAAAAERGLSPALASFAGDLLTASGRRSNPALWPLIVLAAGVVAVLLALYTRDWMAVVIVGLIAFNAVVGAAVLAYVRSRDAGFPFRERIPEVDAALERGGALVTVRCTLPYRRTVEELLERSGGQVLGYASEVIYPVPA
jgi:hypothetical protein